MASSSSSLASLLGRAPPPVLSPAAAEKRLSRMERRVATAAFHRARGYGERIDLPRFRDTLLHEAFGATPLLVLQRLFAVWNFGAGGALTLKEFLVGVAIAWKGSREEHLRFAFQLMDRHADQELAKRDAVAFLRAVARADGVVAVEQPSGRRWTVDEFAALLFPTDSTVLTPTKFVKVIAARSFAELALVDWIPKLAAQFEREKQKLSAVVTPVAKPASDNPETDADTLMDTIMVKLRRMNSGESATSSSTGSSGASPPPSIERSDSEVGLFQIEPTTADQFQRLKAVLAGLIKWVLATNEPISDDDIEERLRDAVSSTVLLATRDAAKACAGDFLLSVEPLGADEAESIRCDAKRRLFWWILCICCSCARSSAEVLRYLFVLFDEESRGYWTLAQLTTFIRCADFRDEEQSTHEEAAFLAQTVYDEFMESAQQTPAVKVASREDPILGESPMFRFRDFEKYLVRYPISGCSSAEIDIIFTLFHLRLSRERGQKLAHRSYLEALHAFCDQLITFDVSTQYGFCLTTCVSWERLVDWVCDYDSNLPLVSLLKHHVCTAIDASGATTTEKIIEYDEKSVSAMDSLVAVPMSLWLVLAARLHEQHISLATPSGWVESAAKLAFPPLGGSKRDGSGSVPMEFRGLLASLTLTINARDGSECCISIPHCIVDQELPLQVVVQIALSLHGRERGSARSLPSPISTHPQGAFFCDGDIVLSNAGGTYQRLHVSQDILLIALNALDEGAESNRLGVTITVLLSDERSNSNSLPRWPVSMISSPASSQRSGASTPSSRTPKHSKRNASGGWTKIHGLANLGNTCFMNSALQCLAATPILREYFLKGDHLFDLSTHLVSSTTGSPFRPGRKNGKDAELQLPRSSLLPVAFGQLLAEMNAYSSNGSVSGMADVISPKYMKTAIATLFPHLSDGTQQDAQEFLTSLLSSLSDELKRLPARELQNGTESSTAGTSPSLMSRFASLSRSKGDASPVPAAVENTSVQALSRLRYQVNDSDGRSDELVAKEWWISHLIAEPSLITSLFCGQFKSTLKCSQCGYTSTRFEPFSSLQLPLQDEAAMLSPRKKIQHQQVVVVLHFLDSPCHQASLRLVIQGGLEWTVEQLLIKLQQDHATYSTSHARRDHIAVTLSGFTVDDYIDPDALISSIAMPINVFEIDFGEEAVAFSTTQPPPDWDNAITLESGTKVLARASYERWVKAVVDRPGLTLAQTSTSASPARSPTRSPRKAYHVCIEEAGRGSRVLLNKSDLRPYTPERFVLLRFVHRRPGLVPFYATSPYRQVLCGFPFVCRLPSSLICGRGLYHMIHRKFAAVESLASDAKQRRSFVLKRVRSDGKACNRCHWGDQCDGCKLDRLNEDPLDLEMDETIAIDWLLDAHEPADDWLASGYCIDDHTSYVAYKLDNTHSLEKSLEILCAEEKVEARCSHCTSGSPGKNSASDEPPNAETNRAASAFVAHTKALALWSLPPILVIHLKRFELVADGGYTWQRLNHSVDFQVDDFNLADFLSEAAHTSAFTDENEREEVARAASFLVDELQFPIDTASRDVTSYRLYGIVNHMGHLGGGHYTAHIRHPDNADWWLVDDASATPANPQTLSPSSSAYLLFFVREDLDPTLDDEDDDDNDDGLLASRPRSLTDFYPRQSSATQVPDSVVRALCKQDFWQRSTSSSSTTSKHEGTRDDGNCSLM